MKILTFILIILALSFNSYAQTAKIAYRSHSGNDKTFRVTGNDNWGTTPDMKKEIAKRDSALKARTDSIARRTRADSIQNKFKTDSLKQPAIGRKQKTKPVKKQKKST